MRTPLSISMFSTALVAGALVLNFASTSGCGGKLGGDVFGGGNGNGSSSGGSGGGNYGNLLGGSGGGEGGANGATPGAQCPSGAQCDVSCGSGATTSISGVVTDPAGKNPLFNIQVYVPGAPLQSLNSGVGPDACDCSALYKSGAIASTVTAVDGTFTLANAPVGASVPLVVQIGKWRKEILIKTTQCMDNPQGSIALPGTLVGAGPNDSMPEIAVSTGSADTLECLMLRIGVPKTEYTAGAGGTQHVHIFAGGQPAAAPGGGGRGRGGGGGGGGGIGTPENPGMAGAPASDKNLWLNQGQLMPYDIVLLSCEGGETYDANPQALEQYLNVGGRAFASHFHYAFFSGPLDTTQNYTAPADWGTHLATWTPGDGTGLGAGGGAGPGGGGGANVDIGGIIDQTLNGSMQPFPKGVDLDEWLTLTKAIEQDGGVAAGELPIYQPRYNAVVGAANTPSQPWIIADQASGASGNTMYFSFDTPVSQAPAADGGAPAYCGRAVFSDLHVDGNPTTKDTPDPPGGCDNVDLSPQEKALEFMLFDLSSCVLPDTVAPPTSGISVSQ